MFSHLFLFSSTCSVQHSMDGRLIQRLLQCLLGYRDLTGYESAELHCICHPEKMSSQRPLETNDKG